MSMMGVCSLSEKPPSVATVITRSKYMKLMVDKCAGKETP
jgi:hypothetical protein